MNDQLHETLVRARDRAARTARRAEAAVDGLPVVADLAPDLAVAELVGETLPAPDDPVTVRVGAAVPSGRNTGPRAATEPERSLGSSVHRARLLGEAVARAYDVSCAASTAVGDVQVSRTSERAASAPNVLVALPAPGSAARGDGTAGGPTAGSASFLTSGVLLFSPNPARRAAAARSQVPRGPVFGPGFSPD